MPASASMKDAAGYLLVMLVLQTTLVSQLVNMALQLPPHTAASVAHCGASLRHYQQRIAVLYACMLSTAFAAALLTLHVRHRAAGANEALTQPPARMLRASMLLAVALTVASTVLTAPTLFYVLEVRMAAAFYCLSDSAKAILWAFHAMAALTCAFWQYRLAALSPSGTSRSMMLDASEI